ncbi:MULTISPECIES: VOC family protein [Pseudoalteromonas]|jgi:catechol 2,3-dioxygenase-like lactoylglutathione lyase family enzyme|uniref:Enzyme protein n=1 Tax=Pseudoalteromonas translucida (strain TAC 125) TaxID=326442 RepID=Q3ICZ0_PSET1|nr:MULTISPECIES: VOC family protein [Pseudoalteromonas]MBB1406457.1 VOC family protein [Pseudoalteromonas sp. SG44-5]MBH0072209.1 VOC family protein [Pseudoalteromonas sp. NZS127]MBH0092191.1 VOC family protein [Pseudoalteromonas sp. SCQQ13]MBO7926347.1 VOC family protein [Pseudoalteromonas sp. K222D]WMS96225.1 VOC family protein [Pseudoalteromonas sp. HL-AS2]|tara:strand:+ start:20755 stop:21138 length:384 start_codon:yes stop_codon:yes gene_type:complete
MSIYTHTTVGTNDLNKARAFYDNVLSIIGLKRIADLDDNGSIWGVDAPSFFVLKPANGQPATVGNGTMVSFEAPDRASIDAFHAAALAAGCPDEGAPGTRGWAPNAYAAYTRDLDGNKLAVYCFKAA